MFICDWVASRVESYRSYSYGSLGKPPSTSQIIVLPAAVSSVLRYSSLPASEATRRMLNTALIYFMAFIHKRGYVRLGNQDLDLDLSIFNRTPNQKTDFVAI